LPEEAPEIVRKADELMAEHGEKLSKLCAAQDALDAEFGVAEQERRAAAEQRLEEEWRARRKALLDEEDVRLGAIADAEAAARALADAIGRTLASNARMASLAQALSPNGKVPMALNGADLVMRMAARLAAVMSTVKDDKGRRGWLGPIEWKGVHSVHPVNQDWHADEEKRIAAGLQPLIEGRI
jgi:hypothetical protein